MVLELDVAGLAATRFVTSPLCETLRAVALLGRPDPPSVNRPWVRWARGELERRPLRLPRLWPLIVTDLPYWPEFLFPAPTGKSPGLEEELACLRTVPDEPVRASLRRIFGVDRWPDTATVEVLLGAPRARLLGALRSPATTSALARRFGVTPGAVSQHLAVQHRSGLVDRQRSGRMVLYQTSALGLALLGAADVSTRAGSL